MRFYAARMSSHANKCRLKQGIRHRREGVRRRREGDPEAPDPEVAVKVLVAVTSLERQAEEHRRDHGPIAARQGQGIEALMHSCQDAAFNRNFSM